MIAVHVIDDAGLALDQGRRRRSQDRRCVDPVNTPEAGDEMGACHAERVETEVAEADIGFGRGMAGEITRLGVVHLFQPADQGDAGAGQRIGKAGGAVDQE